MVASSEPLHLLSAVSFHFSPARLPCLRGALSEQPSLAPSVTLHVFTNARLDAELRQIEDCLPPRSERFDARIESVPPQSHPFFLTWAHKRSLAVDFAEQTRFTHFLYVEDDLRFRAANLRYWLVARELLRAHRLIPGFLRVERNAAGTWVSTDLRRRIRLWRTPALRLDRRRWFLNLRNPYQGLYLFDRELALEHLAGPAMHPDFGPWAIREQAAQGQTFVDVPDGFHSRIVVPFDPRSLSIEPECHVHHLPNRYADDPTSPFGSLPLAALVEWPTLARAYARVRPVCARYAPGDPALARRSPDTR